MYILPLLGLSQVKIAGEKITRLNGDWNLVLNQFLSYEETFEVQGEPLYVPSTWNQFQVDGEEFSGQGYGTYFKTIELSEKDQDYIIYVRPVGIAYSIYVNDILLGHVGNPSKDPAKEEPKIQTDIYQIPQEFSGKTITIILHISNYSHRNGGLWYAPEVAEADYFYDTHLKRTIINMLVLGSILIIMCYHLFLFILRPKERYSLYFSLTCLCLLVHSMSQGDIPILYLFPETPWHVVVKMSYVTLFTIGSLNLMFIRELYPELVSKKVNTLVAFISFLGGLFGVIFAPAISNYLVLPFQIITMTVGIYLLVVMIIASSRNLNGARILLIGYTITFLAAIHDVLNSQFIIESTPAIQYGVFIYVLTLSMVLAKRFTNSITINERLRFELNEFNNELEDRVEQRTSELINQKELVAEQNEELNQIMTVLAHDLKSPLLNINSLSQMMVKQEKEKLKESSAIMQKIAKDGVEMIDRLISLKKFENEDIGERFKPINISQLMELKILEFSPQAKLKSQTIKSNIKEDIVLSTSERHFSKVIENLLSNAIKFSPIKSEIKLTLTSSNKLIQLFVSDEGPGFSSEDKELIFRKFQRLSATPTAGESSSGLGLSIVNTLVKKLGGKIQLNSEEGKGSEFNLIFPSS
ncbi:Signal transduction histidine kinase [Ekhidna lutea]|uniref:histidine kinase n=1 Tax=Ekhidna lutea TaxID=447679 RepID=A0A239M7R4_EKHLU|nr:sensor histidine kinase [Ekhidna lutea]SNT38480.1 Signal transduction histidine kinase [Ekhidna lutea]